ncbi:MAG: hypothetical protein IT535_15895 [Bauldia sp.]|nr:hypothetical protein [Bauldia sp.]
MSTPPRVRLDYRPRKVFLPYHRRRERWAVIVAHRRCGKTVACINDMIRRAATLEKPNGRFSYVAPFMTQAKETAWDYLKRYALPITAAKNEAELWVELVNGARIRIQGADNPDRLRGSYLDGVVLDEFADMRPSVWGEVIRPMLADREGWATFIGTPKGRNEFYEIWERGRGDPAWLTLQLKASETRLLSLAELASARSAMTPEQYEQEFECSFEAAILGAYYGKELANAEREGRIKVVPVDPLLPVHTAWDLGIGDSTAIWMFQVTAGEVRLVDFYENHGEPLAHYVEVLKDRAYRYGDDFLPHDAKVRSMDTGRTRVETLRALGRRPRLVPDHTLMDGINAARLLIGRAWFDRHNCRDGLEALRQYRTDYDERLKTFRDAPRHDWASHAADAFRYVATAYRELAAPAVVAPKPVDLRFEVVGGRVRSNMSVWDIVEAKRKKREAE